MKIKEFTQKGIILVTKDSVGRLIYVKQIDAPEFDKARDNEGFVTLPIVVDYDTYGESLVGILEERKKLKAEVESLGSIILDERRRRSDEDRWRNRKKWWEFWK